MLDPTVSDGSGLTCVIATMNDGAPVDRRIDVGARLRTDVECRGSGAFPAAELVPANASTTPAEHAPCEPGERAGVGLRAERLKRDRTVAARVVANRRHP